MLVSKMLTNAKIEGFLVHMFNYEVMLIVLASGVERYFLTIKNSRALNMYSYSSYKY